MTDRESPTGGSDDSLAATINAEPTADIAEPVLARTTLEPMSAVAATEPMSLQKLRNLAARVEARAAHLRGRLEKLTAVGEQEAMHLRAEVEQLVHQNARLARIYFAWSSREEPEPFDVSPLRKLAEQATGKSWQELLASETEVSDPAPAVMTAEEQRTKARRRLVAATPLLPTGESPLELYARSVIDAEPVACDALSAVRAFVEDKAFGVLVLSGGVGTFKTGSACWMLAHKGGQYVGASDLLKVAFDEKERLVRLREARYVVLDDLGTEVRDERGRWVDVFNTLWNAWYASCTKVVVTCNLSVDQFRAPPDQGGYGLRAYDRVRERGRWVTLAGASRRQRRAL